MATTTKRRVADPAPKTLAKQAGCARGVYATADWSWVLEGIRTGARYKRETSWYLKRAGQPPVGCWTGALKDALTWANKIIQDNAERGAFIFGGD